MAPMQQHGCYSSQTAFMENEETIEKIKQLLKGKKLEDVISILTQVKMSCVNETVYV